VEKYAERPRRKSRRTWDNNELKNSYERESDSRFARSRDGAKFRIRGHV